jgi:Family of unknown function (DUF6057)
MKLSTYTFLKWLFLLAYLLIAFIYITNVIQPELIYHSQRPPFILGWGFCSTFLMFPGGIAQYISDFLSQFFYFGWPGALVLLSCGLIIMLSCYFIFRSFKATGFSYFWIFIPVILLIAELNNYTFPFVVGIKILLVYLAVWFFRFLLQKKLNSFILFIVFVPIIYYVAGSGSLMIFSATIILANMLDSENIKKSLIFLIFCALYTYLFALVSFKYIFSISPDEAYFSILPDMPNFIKFIPGVLFNMFCYSLPLMTLIILLHQKILYNHVKKGTDIVKKYSPIIKKGPFSILTIPNLCFVAVIAGLSYFTFSSTFDLHKKNIILADYYCYNEKWDKVIGVALSDRQYDIFINLNYNRALDNTGHYLDSYFNYPQLMGIDALIPDNISAIELSEICSDYYYDLGYISESQHWAYESLTVLPYNIRMLKRLVMTNLIYNNYAGAREYLEILDKNFLTKDFVEKYRPYIFDTTLAARDILILEKRSLLPESVHLSNIVSNRLQDLINKNDKNRRAYEHLQMSFILSNDLGQFMKNFSIANKFYNKLPEIYEQALLMYLFMTKSANMSQYNISVDSQQSFYGFLKTMHEYNGDKELAKADLEKYSGTYMYYVTYNSPLVTKLVLAKGDGQKY